MTFCLGRLAQTNTATEYFLGDALGSVRQLTAQNGQVTLAKSYAPYGEVTSSSGSSSSPFAYTGEQMDATGLTYLRARYYSPLDGRFMSRDTWGGDYNRPLSMNRWNYVEGNPVNLTDPTGFYARQAAVDYAMAHKFGLGLEVQEVPGNQCTNFVSSALWAGGIRDPRPDPRRSENEWYYQNRDNLKYDGVEDYDLPEEQKWQPPYWDREVMTHPTKWWTYKKLFLREWYVTDELVDFLTSNSFGDSISYAGVIPQFRHDLETDGANRNNDDWTKFLLNNKSTIRPGDLVFYKWNPNSGFDWDHAAMVTDWDVQTYFDTNGDDPWTYHVAELLYMAQIDGYPCTDPGYDYNILKPRVVDASGDIVYDESRSIDNTNVQISQIMIIHMR